MGARPRAFRGLSNQLFGRIVMTIRNPIEWGVDQLKVAGVTASSARRSPEAVRRSPPAVRRVGLSALRQALAAGFADFAAYRTDVMMLAVIYPVIGVILARFAFGYDMLPLLFPLASGFALIGPFAAIGLYEMSRRRETGEEVTWADAFGVLHSDNVGAVAAMGLILMAIFFVWLFVAQVIYDATLGPQPPASLGSFFHDVLTTEAGWMLILVGCGVGFLFAAAVLAISVVSFPLLLDREVGPGTAMTTSLRAVAANPLAMASWGLIVAVALVAGSIPFLLGLVIVMPVLGHATWHLYRRVVAP
jgi:uncharacterized membrane protein